MFLRRWAEKAGAPAPCSHLARAGLSAPASRHAESYGWGGGASATCSEARTVALKAE